MPKQGQSKAQANRAMRQEALREQLSKQKHIEQVVKNIKKIECLDHDSETFTNEVTKYKIANEQRLKLINKYLPDLRATEHTADGGNPLVDLFAQLSGKTVGPNSKK